MRIFLDAVLCERRRQKIKQSVIAEKLGISQASYSRIETGKSEMSARQMIVIADCVGLFVYWTRKRSV